MKFLLVGVIFGALLISAGATDPVGVWGYEDGGHGVAVKCEKGGRVTLISFKTEREGDERTAVKDVTVDATGEWKGDKEGRVTLKAGKSSKLVLRTPPDIQLVYKYRVENVPEEQDRGGAVLYLDLLPDVPLYQWDKERLTKSGLEAALQGIKP